MKFAFIKSNTHWGGPWFSFKYLENNIDSILKNSYGKAGHPIPMIIYFKMDVYVVNNKDLINVDDLNYNNLSKKNPIYEKNLLKKMKNVYNLKDINFDNYDIIYTEDEIIPKTIVEKYKKILFVFNASEHTNDIKFYDLLINHKYNIFPHPNNELSYFINENRKDIYLEYRTAYNDDCIKIFEKSFLDRKIIYNENMKNLINPWINKEDDSCYNFWYNLGKCKYYIQLGKYLQGIRIGQGFVNAASLKLINIGFCNQDYCNIKIIHPYCICKDENSAIKIINDIENDITLYNNIINYQNNILEQANKNYKNIIKNYYLLKNNITRNIDKKHISITWHNELYKSAGDEDKFIISYFKNKFNGYLLDIACACPVSGSLTYKLLNNYFWNGILIEPNVCYKKNIEACYHDVSGVFFYNGAVHNTQKTLTLYVPKNRLHVGLGSLIENNSKRYSNDIYKLTVPCLSINNILEKYNAPFEIDFINLDIEGSEGEVLYNIDYSKYNIKLFCIENGIIYKDFLFSKGYRICHTKGYNIVHGNIFFEKIY